MRTWIWSCRDIEWEADSQRSNRCLANSGKRRRANHAGLKTPHGLVAQGWQQKDPTAVKARSSKLLPIVAPVVGEAAHVPVAVAAEDWGHDWTVVTMARDGSWGVGIDYHIAGANAAAIRECRAVSDAEAIFDYFGLSRRRVGKAYVRIV